MKSYPQSTKITKSKGQKGLAFVELAVALPLLTFMLISGFEIARMTFLAQKVERVAYLIADYTAQEDQLTAAELADFFSAASVLAAPFPFTENARLIITAVVQENDQPVIAWQQMTGAGHAASSRIGLPGLTAKLPQNIRVTENHSLIVTEVFYDYSPSLQTPFFHAQQISATAYYRPRKTDRVSLDMN